MKKLDKKKLQLGRETIRALSSDTLVHANGAGGIYTLLCAGTLAVGCDLPSATCSVNGYELTCSGVKL